MRYRLIWLPACLIATSWLAQAQPAPDQLRQQAIAQRGRQVMPFDLKQTLHAFVKTPTGGTQRVVARAIQNKEQERLVREHLHQIQIAFRRGDFSEPAQIHGQDMPGLAALQAARPGAIHIGYRDIAGGAEINFATQDKELVQALHAWFDAQVSDHGQDAMAGSMHHGHRPDGAAGMSR